MEILQGRGGERSMCFVDFVPGGSYDIHRTHRLRWDLKVKDFTFLEAGNEYTCVTR